MRNQSAGKPGLVLLGFGILCFVAAGTAALLGKMMDLEVCSMCWFQRISFIVAGCGFLLAAIWRPGRIVTRRIAELGLLIGFASAARQTYLMSHLDQVSGSCGAGLFYYWKMGNYSAFLRSGLLGGTDCVENQPVVFGLALPQWSLLALCIIILLYILWSVRNARHR